MSSYRIKTWKTAEIDFVDESQNFGQESCQVPSNIHLNGITRDLRGLSRASCDSDIYSAAATIHNKHFIFEPCVFGKTDDYKWFIATHEFQSFGFRWTSTQVSNGHKTLPLVTGLTLDEMRSLLADDSKTAGWQMIKSPWPDGETITLDDLGPQFDRYEDPKVYNRVVGDGKSQIYPTARYTVSKASNLRSFMPQTDATAKTSVYSIEIPGGTQIDFDRDTENDTGSLGQEEEAGKHTGGSGHGAMTDLGEAGLAEQPSL